MTSTLNKEIKLRHLVCKFKPLPIVHTFSCHSRVCLSHLELVCHGAWCEVESLKGTVISVMLIKHVTDVTEEAWWRETSGHVIVIIITIAT